jgi:hypothetical protein
MKYFDFLHHKPSFLVGITMAMFGVFDVILGNVEIE